MTWAGKLFEKERKEFMSGRLENGFIETRDLVSAVLDKNKEIQKEKSLLILEGLDEVRAWSELVEKCKESEKAGLEFKQSSQDASRLRRPLVSDERHCLSKPASNGSSTQRGQSDEKVVK